jgi:hypothetical protein
MVPPVNETKIGSKIKNGRTNNVILTQFVSIPIDAINGSNKTITAAKIIESITTALMRLPNVGYKIFELSIVILFP